MIVVQAVLSGVLRSSRVTCHPAPLLVRNSSGSHKCRRTVEPAKEPTLDVESVEDDHNEITE